MHIAIVGYGVEGESAYYYFKTKHPDATFVVYDEAEFSKLPIPEDVEQHLGIPINEQSISADIVVRSPAINPKFITTDGQVTSVTKEFFKMCPAPIIGVTGTKGKGTTASLIHSILHAAGKKSWLVGNIGTSAFDVLDQISSDDVVIYELSSFQLWDINSSPHIAIVLMIEPDHLDVHESFSDYVEAKANIRRYQTRDDICYYYPFNEYSRYIATQAVDNNLEGGGAKTYGDPASSVVFVKENTFFVQNHPICSTNSLHIVGKHNIDNACAAISAALTYTHDYAAIEQGLKSFEGLPHRLKPVRELNGVLFIDDSIATTPGSALAAIRSFEQPKILILGGSDKGADFSELYAAIREHNVKQVITIGVLGEKIANELRSKGYLKVTNIGKATMQAIVEAANEAASSGDVVIMSPACASFDMFESYLDRGEQFVSAVQAL